jgi:hypothetical protein
MPPTLLCAVRWPCHIDQDRVEARRHVTAVPQAQHGASANVMHGAQAPRQSEQYQSPSSACSTVLESNKSSSDCAFSVSLSAYGGGGGDLLHVDMCSMRPQ